MRSLWNVGSIFRTADGAGISKLFLCGITGYPPRKEIAKTSLGAEESVPWQYCQNTLEILSSLKSSGTQILGLERNSDSIPLTKAIDSSLVNTPVCILLGNEVTGISAQALSMCDHVCHLPMRGIKESLNVAVAFGIAAYLLSEKLLSCPIKCVESQL